MKGLYVFGIIINQSFSPIWRAKIRSDLLTGILFNLFAATFFWYDFQV